MILSIIWRFEWGNDGKIVLGGDSLEKTYEVFKTS
ncbi:MAG: hypothetical protein JWR09_1721 [Mucilaginibacter sp.]|nr:hypothetical protein [Mucilaginibacter sp.]